MLENIDACLVAVMDAAALASLRGRQIKRRVADARVLALVNPLGHDLAEIVDQADTAHDILCKLLDCRQAERAMKK